MFAQSQARIYKLSCLPTLTPNKESSIIIVGWKTDLQRLHSFHFISINWKYFYFSAEIILLCIISNMLCLDVTPSFVITIIGNMILVNNVIPWTLSTKEKNDSSFSWAAYQSWLKRRYKILKMNKTSFPKNVHGLPKAIKHFQNLKRSKIFSGLKWCLCQNLFLFLFLDLISSFYCKTRGAVTLTKNPIVLHCIVLTKLIVCKLIRYCVPSALNGLKSFFNIKKWE